MFGESLAKRIDFGSYAYMNPLIKVIGPVNYPYLGIVARSEAAYLCSVKFRQATNVVTLLVYRNIYVSNQNRSLIFM